MSRGSVSEMARREEEARVEALERRYWGYSIALVVLPAVMVLILTLVAVDRWL